MNDHNIKMLSCCHLCLERIMSVLVSSAAQLRCSEVTQVSDHLTHDMNEPEIGGQILVKTFPM